MQRFNASLIGLTTRQSVLNSPQQCTFSHGNKLSESLSHSCASLERWNFLNIQQDLAGRGILRCRVLHRKTKTVTNWRKSYAESHASFFLFCFDCPQQNTQAPKPDAQEKWRSSYLSIKPPWLGPPQALHNHFVLSLFEKIACTAHAITMAEFRDKKFN